jgi:hypothetical protein
MFRGRPRTVVVQMGGGSSTHVICNGIYPVEQETSSFSMCGNQFVPPHDRPDAALMCEVCQEAAESGWPPAYSCPECDTAAELLRADFKRAILRCRSMTCRYEWIESRLD